ncbi:uncharacterized protein K452DRAFT_302179 [Aplosporella prunicola CBS 121167]|uniref:FHA domain-containing protein n=1 Tax=Aplosporella prunicola CBS 121167 TaxID=1176127 RepID=A0A6A6B137_9PEZI|nr:uncharacterized protein K452DRAFT_302179 [Aplosporella prunicola CBS 121167]KAF2137143.1 hypothetical protein K452DRAFT_302179 [Aplosporella prunicola CBS 121167]
MDDSPPKEIVPMPPTLSPSRPTSAPKPSLLPAFEPLSSSPLPRAPKRKFDETSGLPKVELKYYPTPMPTSSTGMLPSSPPQHAKTGLQRTLSTLTERNPLCAVPSIEIPANGEPILMGRSSNSSHHQLSANRLISRVHVRVQYNAPSSEHVSGEIVIECMGWNGCKIHCRGQIYELVKGDTFSSDKPSAEIMLDVQDTRVLIVWPFSGRKRSMSAGSDTTYCEDTPTRRRLPSVARFDSSPPPMVPQSPESPARSQQLAEANDLTFLASDPAELPEVPAVQVYEDGESGDDQAKAAAPAAVAAAPTSQTFYSGSTVEDFKSEEPRDSFRSDEFSDRDEENDPVVHSFGPFGENILSRMASFPHNRYPTSHPRPKRPMRERSGSPQQARTGADSTTRPKVNDSPVKNHVINQLAFSRLHSMPLSTILGNLPVELRGGPEIRRPRRSGKDSLLEEQAAEASARLTGTDLQHLLDHIPCIGEINRVGKDASGKELENEFYYVPEMDDNEHRREAVMGGIGGTGLRSVRKSHKQYYWKRPRH